MSRVWKRPSVSEVNAMKKDELKDALLTLLERVEHGTSTPNPGTNDMLKQILKSQNVILSEIQEGNKERAILVEDIKTVKKDNKVLKSVLYQQQRYLEGLDFERRSRNIIITGVKEEENGLGRTDDEKLEKIFREIDQSAVNPVSVQRLGARNILSRRAKHVLDPSRLCWRHLTSGRT
jgi:hypothetical protein